MAIDYYTGEPRPPTEWERALAQELAAFTNGHPETATAYDMKICAQRIRDRQQSTADVAATIAMLAPHLPSAPRSDPGTAAPSPAPTAADGWREAVAAANASD